MKKTEYCYDDRSFRLNVLRTTRNNGQDSLQDLNYYYDAVGNIVGEADYAQQIFYFANQEVEPVFNYTYDPLYRLLTATGREMTALQMPTHEDFPNNIPCPNSGPDAMQNYTQHYQYDALGNMLQMSSQNRWTRDYIYDTATNRLLRHTQQLPDTYSYDTHGNMLTMPHLTSISWDYLDQLHSAGNGTFTSYYNYDAEGNRTRKVVKKGNIREERYYVNGYEIYRKYTNDVLDFERKTINISDDEKVFVRIEQKTGENPVIRYQYDNHLGSACLELDELGAIISYEEYHPFGTTSYRSGRSAIEVSLKRYKYCGKERDEETGLYYYGMRYYAAWLCRFVSVDPLQFQYPYYTPYQYAGNKPVTFIDLDGGEEMPLPNAFKEVEGLWNYSIDRLKKINPFRKNSKENSIKNNVGKIRVYSRTLNENGETWEQGQNRLYLFSLKDQQGTSKDIIFNSDDYKQLNPQWYAKNIPNYMEISDINIEAFTNYNAGAVLTTQQLSNFINNSIEILHNSKSYKKFGWGYMSKINNYSSKEQGDIKAAGNLLDGNYFTLYNPSGKTPLLIRSDLLGNFVFGVIAQIHGDNVEQSFKGGDILQKGFKDDEVDKYFLLLGHEAGASMIIPNIFNKNLKLPVDIQTKDAF